MYIRTPNSNTMNKIELKVVRKNERPWEGEYDVVRVFIDGVDLIDKLKKFERPFALRMSWKKNNIPREKINIALSRVGNSQVEIDEATEYIGLTGYHLLKKPVNELISLKR